MNLTVKEIPNETRKLKLEILKSLKSLNNEILNDYNKEKTRVVDFLRDENNQNGPDLVEPIATLLEPAVTDLEQKQQALDDAVDDDAKIAAQEAFDLQEKVVERLETRKRVIDNYLTNWTRMDLFPGITRENVYPRTAMERTERRDFLGKGIGKVYPFGLKNEHQMSGVGGSSSDIIRIRRLYGRSRHYNKRTWNF